MATKIKIITTGEFLEVTPSGTIDITTSRQLLVEIVRTEQPPWSVGMRFPASSRTLSLVCR